MYCMRSGTSAWEFGIRLATSETAHWALSIEEKVPHCISTRCSYVSSLFCAGSCTVQQAALVPMLGPDQFPPLRGMGEAKGI